MSADRARARRQEAGFTLVELVVAIAILGLVMTAVTAMIMTSLKATQQTEDRLDASNALRRVTPRFAQDVASSSVVKTNVTNAKCGGGDALIELRGLTFAEPVVVSPPIDPASFTTAVAYVYDGGVLTRRECKASAPADGSTPSMTPDETTELVPELTAATAACTPDCDDDDAVYSITLTPPGGAPQTLTATRRTS